MCCQIVNYVCNIKSSWSKLVSIRRSIVLRLPLRKCSLPDVSAIKFVSPPPPVHPTRWDIIDRSVCPCQVFQASLIFVRPVPTFLYPRGRFLALPTNIWLNGNLTRCMQNTWEYFVASKLRKERCKSFIASTAVKLSSWCRLGVFDDDCCRFDLFKKYQKSSFWKMKKIQFDSIYFRSTMHE